MPRMVNGVGTWLCTAHFDAGWGWDDAVECAMFAYMPVWPMRVVHVQMIPGGSFSARSGSVRMKSAAPIHHPRKCWQSNRHTNHGRFFDAL